MTDRKPDKPQKPISDVRRRPTLDEVWPVQSAGGWPQEVALDRRPHPRGRSSKPRRLVRSQTQSRFQAILLSR